MAADLGREDATVAHRLAVAVEDLVDQRKVVALPQVAMKIDLATKNGHQLAGDGFGYAGCGGGVDPRVADLARPDDGLRFEFHCLLADREVLAAALDDPHDVLVGQRHGEGLQLATRARSGHYGGARTELLGQAPRYPVTVQKMQCVTIGNA
jgi:hypothetical protein